jgi:pimeloyl-ACP methyl ester carboxylesterase/DNA-binding CsgD family transcriptional regulator
MRQQIRFCTSADGTKIAYALSGSGPPLLLTTSWVNHLEYAAQMLPWSPWLEALSREYTLLRYDTRGCGMSDRGVTGAALGSFVADIEAVVGAAGFERFSVLGVCSGGPAAIVYALRHPQHVADLVLYGTWGRGRLRRPEKPGESVKAHVMFDLCRLGWALEGHGFLRAWATVFQPGGTAEHIRCWGELQKVSTDAGTAVQLLRASAEVDVLDMAARIRCRSLIIHADRDAVAPLDEAQMLAGRIPGARYVLLDSDNHILLAQEPAWPRFLSEIRSFLHEGADRDERRGLDGRLATLTRREAQVLDAVARGLGNRQIAGEIGVSEKTVRNNVSRIFEKLAVNSRPRAIVLAREAGFGRAAEEGPRSHGSKRSGTFAS